MAGYQSPMMPYPSFMDPDRNTTYMVVPVQNGVVQSPQGPASFSDWSSIQAQQMIAQQLLSCQQSMPQPAPNQENEVLAPSMHLQQMLGLMPYQSFPPIPAMPSVPMTPSRHNSIQGTSAQIEMQVDEYLNQLRLPGHDTATGHSIPGNRETPRRSSHQG